MNMNIVKKFNKLSIQTKASIVYTLASLMTRGINIITVPIFTRIISSSEIGVTTIFSSWHSILHAIATLSLCSGSLSVAMLEYKDRRNQYQSVVLTLSSLSSIIIMLIYVAIPSFWNNIFSLSSPLIGIMLLSFLFTPATEIWLVRQRYEYNYKGTAILTITQTLLSSAFAIVCVIIAKSMNVRGLGTVRIITQYSVLICIAAIIYIRILYKGRSFINKEIWRYALKLSAPLIVHSLSKHILDVSDRIIIASMCGQSEAGIYGTIYNISTLSLIVWTALNNSLVPYMFEKLKSGDNDSIRKIVTPILCIYAAFAFSLTLIAPEVLRIMAPKEYYDAVYIVPAVAAGIYLTSLYNIFADVLMYKHKTNSIMIATIIASISNIVLNNLFIPVYGYIAAAYTTLFSYIVLSVMQYIVMKRVHSGNLFDMKLIIGITGTLIIACLCCNFLYSLIVIRFIVIIVIIFLVGIYHKRLYKIISSLKEK